MEIVTRYHLWDNLWHIRGFARLGVPGIIGCNCYNRLGQLHLLGSKKTPNAFVGAHLLRIFANLQQGQSTPTWHIGQCQLLVFFSQISPTDKTVYPNYTRPGIIGITLGAITPLELHQLFLRNSFLGGFKGRFARNRPSQNLFARFAIHPNRKNQKQGLV